MKMAPHNLARRAVLAGCALWASTLLVSMAAEPAAIPIPERTGNYGWIKRQNVSYHSAPLLAKAHQAVAQKNYAEAAKAFEQVLAVDPRNNHVKVYLIQTYNKLDRWDDSLALCDELLDKYPDYLDLYLTKAFIAQKKHDDQQALEAFAEVVKRAPRDYPRLNEARESLADLYYKNGNYEQAAFFAEQALEQKETLAMRRFLAECEGKLGHWNLSAKHYLRAAEMASEPEQKGRLFMGLGYAYLHQKKYKPAELAFSQAGRLIKDAAAQHTITLERGQIAFLDGRYDEAATLFDLALTQAFDEATAETYLDALMKAGQYRKGARQARAFSRRKRVSRRFQEGVLSRLMYFQKKLDDHAAAYATARKLYKRFHKPAYLLEAAAAADRMQSPKEAVRLYTQYLDKRFDPGAALACHYNLKQLAEKARAGGRAAKAAALSAQSKNLLLKVIKGKRTAKANRHAALYELAQLYRASGDTDDYIATMEILLSEHPEGRFMHEYAVQLYGAKRYDRALELFKKSLEGKLDKPTRYATCKTIADIYLLEKKPAAAKRWLKKARTYGKPDRAWELAYGRADYQQKRYASTVSRLLPLAREDDDVFNLYIGFSFYQMGMPGLALLHLNRVKQLDKLPAEQRFNFFANRAYLQFDQGRESGALDDIEHALNIQPSEDLEIVRLKTLLRLGRYADVLEKGVVLIEDDPNDTLRGEILELLREHPDPEFKQRILSRVHKLSSARQAEVLEIVGAACARLGDDELAADYLTKSIERDPARAQVYYLRGLSYYRLGEFKRAEDDFLTLYDLAKSFPATFWGDLGILEGRLKDYDLGTAAMQRSTEFYPYDVDAYEEMGYQYMKWYSNGMAKTSFSNAIDIYNEVLPYLAEGKSDKEYEEYLDNRHAMMVEYSKLDKTWGLQAYVSKTEYSGNEPTGPGIQTIEGALPSQFGAQISYRPPKYGFRNDKMLDGFVRFLGNFDQNSWNPDPKSYQLGVGAYYKPFNRINYGTSFERLIAIGDNAEDNWLWRNLLSWENGEKPQKYKTVWPYTRLYGEASYFFEDLTRWVYYLDGRFGFSFQARDNILVTVPQGIAVWRYQDNDPTGTGTYSYYGVGLNVRALEGEREYTVDRWYLDLFGHYVWGWFDQQPQGLNHRDFEGLIFGFNFTK